MAHRMKALSGAVLLCASVAVGLPSACVVENHPQAPPPVVVARAPAPVGADAAPDAPPDAMGTATLDAEPDAAAVGAVASPASSFLACSADADCVAVRKNGCCNNGYKEAVNASSVAAYEASFVCPDPHPICPMFRIRDDRVPVCNTSHQCELIKR
jgi:hypothetical protein